MALAPASEDSREAVARAPTARRTTRGEGSRGGGRPLPQNIAHRGFRARYPENTLAAFRAALAGDGGRAAALETDVHLSRDGVVVLSHDATLRRCFGRPERIADCDWAFLSTLRTKPQQQPRDGDAAAAAAAAAAEGAEGGAERGEPMACLGDLLALLAEPGREHVWVLLDIKRDDAPAALLEGIADTLRKAAPAAGAAPWSARIVVGCWDEVYMAASRAALPGFPIAYIGVSLALAYALLRCDDDEQDGYDDDDKARLAAAPPPPTVACFNLLQGILVGARGRRFLRAAHARGRTVLVWTVNAAEWMEWSVRAGVDGVITDDPAAFDAVRRAHEGGAEDDDRPLPHPPTARSVTGLYLRRWAWLGLVVGASRAVEFVWTLALRLRRGAEPVRVRRALKGV